MLWNERPLSRHGDARPFSAESAKDRRSNRSIRAMVSIVRAKRGSSLAVANVESYRQLLFFLFQNWLPITMLTITEERKTNRNRKQNSILGWSGSSNERTEGEA